MKRTVFLAVALFALLTMIGFSMTGCSDPDSGDPNSGDPNSGDPNSGGFVAVTNITGVPTAATVGTALTLTGTVEPATATNKTIVWTVTNGTGTATVSGNTLSPTGEGTVTVKATIANGTAQGTDYTKDFTITVSGAGESVVNPTPTADDFDIGNLTQNVGSVTAVTITPKSGKSTGTITIKYNDSETLPTEEGTYTVTFDVAEVTGWNAASGLSAKTLRIYAEGVFIANSISEMTTWLATQTAATPADAVTVVLNVSDLGGTSRRDGSVGKLLTDNKTKFVSLDLSGSTFTSLPYSTNAAIWEGAFDGCSNLTSVILPDSLTSIGTYAFWGCTSLTSVTIPDIKDIAENT